MEDIKKWRDLLNERMLTTPEYGLTMDGFDYDFIRTLIHLYAVDEAGENTKDSKKDIDSYKDNIMYFRDRATMERVKKLLSSLGQNPVEMKQSGDEIDTGNLLSPYPGNKKIR